MIFSGRPDPEWIVREDVARQAQELWDAMLRVDRPHQLPSRLGYKGCKLFDPAKDMEWWAYEGLVSLRKKATVETREDPNREFEKSILDSAPTGLVPREVVGL
jgi:hypothetical protein